MKTRLTLLLLLITFIVHAQYDYYYYEPTLMGAGVGTNLVSVVGNDITPTEISLKVRIKRKHTLQLYMPYFKQTDAFSSKDNAKVDFIQSSLKTKKSLYGLGLDYDYALQTYSSLDFVIGLRGEVHIHKYRTNLTSKHPVENNYNNIEYTHRSEESTNYIISPNAGLRLNFNQFTVDAKFLLSMLSSRGDVDNFVENKTGQQPSMSSTTTEWSDKTSNKFKLKPAVVMSVGYYF